MDAVLAYIPETKPETIPAVSVDAKALNDALAAVSKAVDHRAQIPAFSCYLLQMDQDAGKLTITGSDGEILIREQIAADVAGPGEILAPAKLFKDLISKLPKREISLAISKSTRQETRTSSTWNADKQKMETSEEQVTVTDHKLTVTAGRSTYNLAGQDAADFPELPNYREDQLATVSALALKRALQRTVFCAVKDSSTGAVHYTNGSLLKFNAGHLDTVATDGHRLAIVRIPETELRTETQDERSLLLPATIAAELEKRLPAGEDDAVEIYYLPHRNQVYLEFGTTLIGASLLDVKFPPYERVIPQTISSKATVQRAGLVDCLPRLLLVARSKDQNPVAHMVSNCEKLEISTNAGELGEGQEEIAAYIEGEELKVAFNPAYMLEMAKQLKTEELTFNWQSDVSPLMITTPQEPDFTFIQMPIRMD